MLITPEDGGAPYYATIAMADNPTQAGTPWSMETVLQSVVAQALGLTQSDPVPNDAFAKLASAAFVSGSGDALVDALGTVLLDVPGVLSEVGSYTGTGQTGASGACSVTADFEIAALIILASYDDGSAQSKLYSYGCVLTADMLTTSYKSGVGLYDSYYNSQSGTIYARISADGKTFSWYNTASSSYAYVQFNESGVKYFYLLIGTGG